MSERQFSAEHFINRELSWLEFNARVLEEAEDPATPLLEQVKFLSIVSSNLDEFFMVRVAGLREQVFGGGVAQDRNADGMTATEQLKAVSLRTQELVARQYRCLNDSVLPKLEISGITLVDREEIAGDERSEAYFWKSVYPVITPMAVDPSHPRPRYHNRSLYLAAQLRRREGLGPKKLFAVVQIPQVLPRLVPLHRDGQIRFALLEDLVAARLPDLFGGFSVKKLAAFRITRDSDLDVIAQESDDMMRLIEQRLKEQRRADAVRMEVGMGAAESLVERIIEQEHLRDADEESGFGEIYRVNGPIDLTALMSLTRLPGMEQLHDPPFTPTLPRGMRRPGEDLFEAIRRHDVLLHHPYDSFGPVEEFVRSAARDPRVLAIKQTLYRTSGDSPILDALVQAAEDGKHVTALVELQARFDEEANIVWARRLERSGVHVVFGFMDLKTHCKVSLVVREEDDGPRRYVHLGTGNYNPVTAKLYTDMGLFTADAEIAADVSALFNLLTGYSQGHAWGKLVVAPDDLHRRTVELIDEQTALAADGKPARIFAKFNAMVDPPVIEALYRASQAGVNVDLVVRGICCLRPGIPGISDNIRVLSIVDRFLEHSRIYVFGEDKDAQIFFSSADWMPRNFYRRVETMFPIESTAVKKRILTEIIPYFMMDNVKARVLNQDGTYDRIQRNDDEDAFRCQQEFLSIDYEDAGQSPLAPTNGQSKRTISGKPTS